MKLASAGMLLLLCVVADAFIDDMMPSGRSNIEKKSAKKKDKEDEVENDDKNTHPDGIKKPKLDDMGEQKTVKKPKIDALKQNSGDKVENNANDNPDKVSTSEARMDKSENIDDENAFVDEADPEMGKDYGEEVDNNFDSVHGYMQDDETPVEDEANSITDMDMKHDDTALDPDDVTTQ